MAPPDHDAPSILRLTTDTPADDAEALNSELYVRGARFDRMSALVSPMALTILWACPTR